MKQRKISKHSKIAWYYFLGRPRTFKLHVHPSAYQVRAGTELYPRIGSHFDIKTWTNCRMGMMAWTFIAICCAFKQRQLTGSIANSMLVSVLLQGVLPPIPSSSPS